MSPLAQSDGHDAPRLIGEAVCAALAALVADIDYGNFKNAVASRQGYDRASVYGDVWGVLYGLQSGRFEEPAEPRMI